MKIPDGMTEQETIDQINKAINRIAHNYTFYGFTTPDLKQESFIICMEALERYDNERRLENFLSANLANRLKNFIRDNHFSPNQVEKGKIVQPAQLDNEHSILDYYNDSNAMGESLDYKEMVRVINVKLPASMRLDYLKIVNDVYLSPKRKEEVLEEVKEILLENNMYFYEGQENEEG